MKPYYYVQFTSDLENEPRHESLAGAQEDAEMLAAENPGDSIVILKCVGIASCSKASTFWMDGEEPAADLREFEFYRNAGGTVFWRVGKDGIEIAWDYGDGYKEEWARSQETRNELESSMVRITADELPESLA
jgi:hypothetical protein